MSRTETKNSNHNQVDEAMTSLRYHSLPIIIRFVYILPFDSIAVCVHLNTDSEKETQIER